MSLNLCCKIRTSPKPLISPIYTLWCEILTIVDYESDKGETSTDDHALAETIENGDQTHTGDIVSKF